MLDSIDLCIDDGTISGHSRTSFMPTAGGATNISGEGMADAVGDEEKHEEFSAIAAQVDAQAVKDTMEFDAGWLLVDGVN